MSRSCRGRSRSSCSRRASPVLVGGADRRRASVRGGSFRWSVVGVRPSRRSLMRSGAVDGARSSSARALQGVAAGMLLTVDNGRDRCFAYESGGASPRVRLELHRLGGHERCRALDRGGDGRRWSNWRGVFFFSVPVSDRWPPLLAWRQPCPVRAEDVFVGRRLDVRGIAIIAVISERRSRRGRRITARRHHRRVGQPVFVVLGLHRPTATMRHEPPIRSCASLPSSSSNRYPERSTPHRCSRWAASLGLSRVPPRLPAGWRP